MAEVTPETWDKLLNYISLGAGIEKALSKTGISRKDFTGKMKDYEFRERLAVATDRGETKPETELPQDICSVEYANIMVEETSSGLNMVKVIEWVSRNMEKPLDEIEVAPYDIAITILKQLRRDPKKQWTFIKDILPKLLPNKNLFETINSHSDKGQDIAAETLRRIQQAAKEVENG